MQRRERGQSRCADKARPPRAPAWHTQLCHWGRAAHRCDLFTEVRAFLPPAPCRTEKDCLYHLHLLGASLLPVGPLSQKARPLRADRNVVPASGYPGPGRPQGSVRRLFSTDPQRRPVFPLQTLSSEVPLQLLPRISRGQKQGNCCPHSPQFTSQHAGAKLNQTSLSLCPGSSGHWTKELGPPVLSWATQAVGR